MQGLQKTHGDEVQLLSLDGMPHAEQIAAFARARVVVGQHGAGLTHAAYMAEGTTLIELKPFVNANFEYLAKAVGVKYVRANGLRVYRSADDTDHIELDPAQVARVVPHDPNPPRGAGAWFGW